MSELKPCPFCGGRAKIEKIQVTGNYRVSCEKCPVTVGRYWYFEESKAIEAWNRRVRE